MAIKVIKNGNNGNLGAVVLYKGDVVELENGDVALVVATQNGNRQLADLTNVTGNYWGDDFAHGTTVAQYNRTHGTEIVAVYGKGEYKITIDLKGGRN